jgi:hypothetical protein
MKARAYAMRPPLECWHSLARDYRRNLGDLMVDFEAWLEGTKLIAIVLTPVLLGLILWRLW